MSTTFQSYADDEISDSSIQMPQRTLDTTTHQFPIDVLARRFEKYLADPSATHDQYPWAARFVMGFPVSSWQSELAWNVGQKSRFIVAVWAGADLGSYLTNDWMSSWPKDPAQDHSIRILSSGSPVAVTPMTPDKERSWVSEDVSVRKNLVAAIRDARACLDKVF